MSLGVTRGRGDTGGWLAGLLPPSLAGRVNGAPPHSDTDTNDLLRQPSVQTAELKLRTKMSLLLNAARMRVHDTKMKMGSTSMTM